jgi:predicted nucleotidyltransferase component of viral defense system
MTERSPVDIARSVKDRLVRIAHDRAEEAQNTLISYCLERLLYRLSRSAHADRLILKGARLFSVWLDAPYRATRDLDLLGGSDASVGEMVRAFREICAVAVDDDGVRFDPDSVGATEIREEMIYGGIRVKLDAYIGTARSPLQIDIGLGDSVVPSAEKAGYPVLLGYPAPVLRMYPPEAMIAEKFEAMVALRMANSCMKDFFDIWALATHKEFRGDRMHAAIEATFTQRRTVPPDGSPVALTAVFGEDAQKKAQWAAFLRKTRPTLEPPDLAIVVQVLRRFLMPPTDAVSAGLPFDSTWPAGGPWK